MYFNHLHFVEDIKKEYRRLAWLHHPDRDGGDTATMQQINAEYEQALKRCDGQTSTGSDNKEHTYRYNEQVERAVMDKINELLKLRLKNVNIWLVGTWLWIDGATRPAKEQLKSAGCRWHRKRQKWYWHDGQWRGRATKKGFSYLAGKYGMEKQEEEVAA